MNKQTSNIIQYEHLKLLKKLNNFFDENDSLRIKEIFGRLMGAETTISDCIERIEKERSKLDAAEETKTILKIEGSNFSELAEAFKSGEFKTLFRLIGVADKISGNIEEFESRYDATLTRTVRETETRNKNINDLMTRKTNAETTQEQSKIQHEEELNNQKAVSTALENPDSKDELIKALERFSSNDPKLGFTQEEISIIAMIVMFPEQYGLTLNDIKKILFSQADTELKNSISDIFAMSEEKEERPKQTIFEEPKEKQTRTNKNEYSKIEINNKVSNDKMVKTVETVLKDATLDLDKEELELARASENKESILNILKYTSKKGVTPSCFKYHIKDLINANYTDFEKISNELLSERPLEDVETIFGNILNLTYEEFLNLYNPNMNLTDIFYKENVKNVAVNLEPVIGDTAQFVDDMIKFPDLENLDNFNLDETGRGMGMSA